LITQFEITTSTVLSPTGRFSILTQTKLYILVTTGLRILSSLGDHLWSHVYPDHFPGRADNLRG
jgi:hypothetical protein